MATPSALTRTKLLELERQRDRLHHHYDTIEARANQAASPLERLRALYDGLRATSFAQTPLHPDVANLDALLFQARIGRPEPELIAGWVSRLEQELARGRLRAEVAYVFGRLLEESPEAPPTGGPPPEAGKEPWSSFWQGDPEGLDLSLIDQVLAGQKDAFANLKHTIREYGEKGSLAPVSDDEVRALLNLLVRDVYRLPELRRQASAVLGSTTMVHEYAGGLTILLNNLEGWNWPEEGVALRSVWTRNKWRPHLDEDLLTLLFLQLVGLRWGLCLKQWSHAGLNGWVGSVLRFPTNLGVPQLNLEQVRFTQAAQFFLPRIPLSLQQWSGTGGGYGGGGYGARGGSQPDALERLLALLVAEAAVRRASQPHASIFLVQTDLRDFYPNIPHGLLHALFEKLDFPPAWRAFFRRFLQVRITGGRVVRRGVTLDHLLSSVLAELPLLLLDVYVYQATEVRLLRVVDDVYFLADSHDRAVAAWQAVGRFCRACGLEINDAKSGSVCLAGTADPTGLPRGLPRWGMLCLHPDGEWRLDEESVQRLEDRLRADLEAIPGVLGMAARASDYLAYLLRNLGVRVALGRSHLAEVGRRVGKLYHELFGPGHGIVEEVRRRIDRFLADNLKRQGLPEALLYWPITAGGLALTHPLVHLAAFERARNALLEPARPFTPFDVLHAGQWVAYFTANLRTMSPAAPDNTPGMERLLSDFIARGTKVSGRQQVGLSAYWQWIVYTYGPRLLDAVGTFRFLLTELVPLQLIYQHRGGVRLFEGEEGGPSASPPPNTAPIPPVGGDDIPF